MKEKQHHFLNILINLLTNSVIVGGRWEHKIYIKCIVCYWKNFPSVVVFVIIAMYWMWENGNFTKTIHINYTNRKREPGVRSVCFRTATGKKLFFLKHKRDWKYAKLLYIFYLWNIFFSSFIHSFCLSYSSISLIIVTCTDADGDG